MILHRIIAHVREQNWTAIAVDFAIVVIGVFVGLQVNLWNEARVESIRRRQIIDALVTTLDDSIGVEQRMVAEIETGLSDWEAAYSRGEKPPPYSYRIEGSDTAPAVWSTFGQMQLTDMFDPVTLFDLMFFYSELDGVGRKYVTLRDVRGRRDPAGRDPGQGHLLRPGRTPTPRIPSEHGSSPGLPA